MNKRVHHCILALKGLNIELFNIFHGIAIFLTTWKMNAESISVSCAFFNFSFVLTKNSECLVTISNLPTTVISAPLYSSHVAIVTANIYSAPFLHLHLTKQLENHFIINPKLLLYVCSYPIKIFQLIPI